MLKNKEKDFFDLISSPNQEEEKSYNEYDEISEDPVINLTHELEPHKYYEWND